MSNSEKYSCVLIGAQSLLIQCAELLLKKGHRVSGVVTSDPHISKWAADKNLRRIDPKSDLVRELQTEPFDILFSIANFTVIPAEVLALPRRYAINFHDGILPDSAGLNVTTWALLNGATEHGITWHIMTAEVDKGEILNQLRFPLVEAETALTLNAKCYEMGIQGFDAMMDALAENKIKKIEQDFSKREYFGQWKRPDAACLINWTRPAQEIDCLVRALEYGPYWNPLGMAKVLAGEKIWIVKRAKVQAKNSTAPPGTITALTDSEIHIATASNEIALLELAGPDGQSLSPREWAKQAGVQKDDVLTSLGATQAEALSRINANLCKKEAYWSRRLAGLDPIEIPYAKRQASQNGHTGYREKRFAPPAPVLKNGEGPAGDRVLAAFTILLSRIGGKESFDIPFRAPVMQETAQGPANLYASHVPLRIDVEGNPGLGEFLERTRKELDTLGKKGSYAMDLIGRNPDLNYGEWHSDPAPVVAERVGQLASQKPESHVPANGSDLTLIIPDDGRECLWVYNPAVLTDESVDRLQDQFMALLNGIAEKPDAPVGEYSIVSETEKTNLFGEWNATAADYSKDRCMHQLFEEQAHRHPDAVALVCKDESLTYAEFNYRTNQLAHTLMEKNVGPDTLVAVLLDRSIDMMVAMMAILKAGGAYVPLDPVYPKDRLAFMVEDAQVGTVITQEKYARLLPGTGAEMIQIDTEWTRIARGSSTNPTGNVASHNLAYVIYTSGSTGKPKGVMVEHRNAVNFFVGMDQRLKGDPPGVWLAVTSLSFDISVLELFWTLARGFKVVLYSGEDRVIGNLSGDAAAQKLPNAFKKIDFSLFYFAADEGEHGVNKYDLLLEGAKYGDEHGFTAVWTPERHFHAFGGLYPSPATISAAIAVLTKKIGIRSGSCVLPLHSPIRITEDWSLVDNLSHGRVGLAFASGWHPNDFVLMPGNFADRHEKFSDGLEQVRALWRGETLTFPGPVGDDVKVRTLPRPIQPELPVWITAAGNPDTFRQAGEMGTNMLTHLLGQSIEELAEKIEIYREAWRKAGHPGEGFVSLMLHTFVADDEEFVRSQVKEPLKDYLRAAGGLIYKYASSFPTFKNMSKDDKKSIDEQFQKISPEDLEAMLEHAFLRYYETSGLFGTPESCMATVDRLKGLGVDDVACLIDFGIPSQTVLKHLPFLNDLKERTSAPRMVDVEADYSVPALIKRHKVTHLQCTPSMAGMLAADEDAHDALKSLQQMMVGGEAFPTRLAADLHRLVGGSVINMYGPTETTIWSSTHTLDGAPGPIPIGTPIANTQLYVLDKNLQPVPVGVPGELLIAGDGVVRGYLFRPELTDERFVPDPFSAVAGARMYRTGDLVRYRSDGVLEFLGRMDHQVKIRGYRIELGEIESILSRHTQVQETVVLAREDAADNKQLVAYVIGAHGKHPTVESLRSFLRERLPEYMIPSVFMMMDVFPQTPNGKVDRKALPAPEQARQALEGDLLVPKTFVEVELVKIWKDTLGIEEIGTRDSYFDLGGHSLSAVQVTMQIRQTFDVDFPMRMVFQAPTLPELAASVEDLLLKQADDSELDALLAEIENMSDDEVDSVGESA